MGVGGLLACLAKPDVLVCAACRLSLEGKNKMWAPQRRFEKRVLGPRCDPGSTGCMRGVEPFRVGVRDGLVLVSVCRTLRVIRLLTTSQISLISPALCGLCFLKSLPSPPPSPSLSSLRSSPFLSIHSFCWSCVQLQLNLSLKGGRRKRRSL